MESRLESRYIDWALFPSFIFFLLSFLFSFRVEAKDSAWFRTRGTMISRSEGGRKIRRSKADVNYWFLKLFRFVLVKSATNIFLQISIITTSFHWFYNHLFSIIIHYSALWLNRKVNMFQKISSISKPIDLSRILFTSEEIYIILYGFHLNFM